MLPLLSLSSFCTLHPTPTAAIMVQAFLALNSRSALVSILHHPTPYHWVRISSSPPLLVLPMGPIVQVAVAKIGAAMENWRELLKLRGLTCICLRKLDLMLSWLAWISLLVFGYSLGHVCGKKGQTLDPPFFPVWRSFIVNSSDLSDGDIGSQGLKMKIIFCQLCIASFHPGLIFCQLCIASFHPGLIFQVWLHLLAL